MPDLLDDDVGHQEPDRPRGGHAGRGLQEALDGVLEHAQGDSWCEWKGAATYWDLVVGTRRVAQAGWSYENPAPGFEHLAGAVAFYPGKVDRALVDGEPARPQAGGFYGGWITDEVVGPFKGEPGTFGW